MAALLLLLNACEGREDQLVEYERSGGFERGVIELRIFRNGSAVVDTGVPEESRLSEDELEGLVGMLDEIDFDALEDEDLEADCSDCFIHTIEYEGHSVEATDAPLPPELGPVVVQLTRIMADVHDRATR